MKLSSNFILSLLLLLIPLGAEAANNSWSGSGPFATGLGNRVITALAVSDDGKAVYSGTGSGTVFGYSNTSPTVTTGAATGVSASGATLNAMVNANNADATVTFEYGLTTSYGATVSVTPATATGTSDTAVSAALTGLTAGTVYHYRFTAVNSGGTNNSTDQTFTTWLAPALTSASATSFAYSSSGTFSVTASGIPAPSFATTSTLPGGVTLNSNGTLSGTPTQSGSFPLTITATNSAGTTSQSFTLTVNKATPVITWPAATAITYGQTLASSTLTGGAANVSGSFAFTTPATAPGVGSVSQGVTFTPADTTNYNGATGSTSVTVGKASSNVTAWPAASAITYGQTLVSSTLTGGSATPAGTFAFTTPATAPGAGSASQDITFTPADTGNYNTASAGQVVTVNKATLTVTADNKNRAYNTVDPAFTASYSGFVNGENSSVITGSPTFTTSADSSSPEGSYSITPVVTGLSADNYSFSVADGTLSIGLASQTITFNPLPTKIYGNATFNLAAIGGASGNPVTYSSGNTSVATVSGSTVTIVGAGAATITANQAGTAGAYGTATAQQILTVNKATLTVTAQNASRPYNTANPVLTSSFSGFVNNEDATVVTGAPILATTATPASPVGSYPVTVALGTLTAANYDFTFVNGTLAVGLIIQSIDFAPLTAKTYGDTAFDLSATGGGSGNPVTFSSSNTSVATISGMAVTIKGTGNAVITASQAGNSNYASATTQQILTVNKATLTVTADNKSRAYGEASPAFTAIYSGFVNNEDAAVLQGAPSFATTADAASGAGSYPITAAVGNLFSNNYSFSYTSGTLTVNKATPVITWPTATAITYGQTLASSTLSGGSATPTGGTFAWTTPTSAPNAGTASQEITCTPADTANYNTVTGSANVTVSKAAPTITWTAPAAVNTGTALSATELNASANTAGTFSYTPNSGTVLSAGSHSLSVNFTPNDTSNYNNASASVNITVNAAPVVIDTTPPTVDTLIIPATLASLTCPVTSFTASDATGVTGYLVSESASQPATDAVWSTTAPAEYTFTSQGTKKLYAFAKDAAGNVSVPLSASVTITMSDTTAPTVTGFTIPATAAALTVSVTTFEATDDTAVTAWLLSETATATAGDSRWAATKPADYTFASQGSKTLYAFTKDASGNISVPLSASVIITLPDTTAPTVTGFIIPVSSATLAVAISSLTASDDSGVTGYLVSESGSQPAADATGWSADASTGYIFTSQGSKTLYAFAKDAAGNVSAAAMAPVAITLPDTTAPTVTSFTIPATSTSLTVAVSSFIASDDTAVTGWLISETATASAGSGNWTATPTSSYTFATAGAKTLYAFARDAAGNISAAATAAVVITLPDTTAPVVSGFTVTGSANSLTVAVTSFTASDDSAVTGYIVTESATAPAAADSGWASTPPASYTFATGGGKTLYAYAKDAAGNVSASAATTVTVSTVLRNGNSGSGAGPTIVDALKALQAYLGLVTLSSDDQIRYDVAPLSSSGVPEGNGTVDFSDAIIILRRSIGIGSW